MILERDRLFLEYCFPWTNWMRHVAKKKSVCSSPIALLLVWAAQCLQAPNTCPRMSPMSPPPSGDDIHSLRNSTLLFCGSWAVAESCCSWLIVVDYNVECCSLCSVLSVRKYHNWRLCAGESQLVRQPDGHSWASSLVKMSTFYWNQICLFQPEQLKQANQQYP